ncbi:OLC1v1027694C6 [Oldenlandia corymbosa var. corymbosa]|uniref:OLC1v1027694C6 n=1 Tax=Oldenlandia corymbosa var. corymbosa TaxID=529605 RepID=A0AAV1CCS9_OLDCO|nr:OLC1v1027694C6 [Oldenlandia corymbosa var. corymbosa]
MQASQAISSTSMRYISENVQFSIMQNSIFPQPSPQLYGFGFGEAVSENVPLQTEDGILNGYGSSFCMDTSPDHFQNTLIGGLYSDSPIFNYQSGPGPSSAMTIKRLDCASFEPNHFTNEEAISTTAYDSKRSNVKKGTNIIPGPKKRLIEHVERRPEIVVGNRAFQGQNDHQWRIKKRMPMPVKEKTQMLGDPVIQKENNKDVQRLDKVPVPQRRSQKLADKITALQKLVSPYGKTDTASVLHEASMFIKVLQDQIQNSYHAIRSASVEEEYGSPHSKVEI